MVVATISISQYQISLGVFRHEDCAVASYSLLVSEADIIIATTIILGTGVERILIIGINE